MKLTAAKRTQPEPDPDAAFESAAPERAAINYGPLNRRLGYVLRRAQIAVFRDFFAEFEAFDIRPGQYSILTVIESNPGLKQSMVSEALGIKRANLVAMIDELERRGLVRRDAAPNDRRSNALVLTEAGERLIAKLHAIADRHDRRFAEILGADALGRLFESLRKLARTDETREP